MSIKKRYREKRGILLPDACSEEKDNGPKSWYKPEENSVEERLSDRYRNLTPSSLPVEEGKSTAVVFLIGKMKKGK